MKLNKVYNEDCLLTMAGMPDNFLDLTVTSPPYDALRNYKGYTFNFETIAKELFRVTKPGGVIVWVVGDQVIHGSESGTSFRQALFFKEIGFKLWDTMFYKKNGSSYPEKKRYYQCIEYMFVCSKGKPKTANLLRDRKNKWPQGSWGRRSCRNKSGELIQKGKVPYREYGVRFNIWAINTGYGFTTKDKESYAHPAMFPEALAQDHILSWSNPGDVVYDPMAGSGTTLKMAMLLKRNFVGSEISEEYCNLIEKRLDKYRVLESTAEQMTGLLETKSHPEEVL